MDDLQSAVLAAPSCPRFQDISTYFNMFNQDQPNLWSICLHALPSRWYPWCPRVCCVAPQVPHSRGTATGAPHGGSNGPSRCWESWTKAVPASTRCRCLSHQKPMFKQKTASQLPQLTPGINKVSIPVTLRIIQPKPGK